MTDMRRLRDETRSPFARSLLESVEGDGPESGACDRALGALGLGTAGVVAAGTAAKAAAAVVAGSAASASTASTASGLAPAATKGGIVVLVKWIGIGVLGSAVTIGSIAYVDKATHSRAPQTIEPAHASLKSVSPVASPTAEAAPPPREGASIARSNTVDDSAISSPSVPRVAGPGRDSSAVSPSRTGIVVPDGKRNSHATEARAGDDVAREATSPSLPKKEEIAANDPVTAQLDALSTIRAALASGDPARALLLIDALESRNPMSPLAEEIAVLRIDALADAGRGDEASALATSFTSAYPQSAYGQHVRSKTKSR